MKRLVYSVMLSLVASFAAFAQSNENVTHSLQTEPRLIAEFNDTVGEWYKLTPELISTELAKNPSAIALLKIKKDKKFASRLKMLRLGFALRQVSLSQVILLIVNKQEHDTNVFIASSCSEIPKCEDCIVMRAMDIGKIETLFQPETITKRRKKK